jgi:adhesin transport system outer membrane protein
MLNTYKISLAAAPSKDMVLKLAPGTNGYGFLVNTLILFFGGVTTAFKTSHLPTRPWVRHIIVLLSCVCGVAVSHAQAVQPLTLGYLLEAASATYPSMLAARLEAKASTEDVEATERIKWPTVSATVESYTGNLRSYPSRAMQVDQTVWDAGRNDARISESKALANISLLKVNLQQHDLFLQIVAAWQNMIASKERLNVAQQTQKRLEAYQAQMRRRVEAQASPRIDLELADSRLLQTEVELATAQTSLQVAVMRLEQLSGEGFLSSRVPQALYPKKLADTQAFAGQLRDVDWLSVAREHPSVARARIEVSQLRSRLDAKQAEAYPQLFVRVYKPIGTTPTSMDTSTTAFVGLRYSPGAGFSNFVEAQAIGTRIASSEQSVETVIRETQQTLQNDREEFVNARLRIAALEKSVTSSAVVLESYQRQFQAGRKQWQDLLNQVRELAQNQYALADAQAVMVGAMHRLQVRMGQELK